MMIIPIFISHLGCPNDCVFCNQKEINGHAKIPTPDEVIATINAYLETAKVSNVGIAFYGGSFTGIDSELQIAYLSIAHQYKKEGKLHHIRLSTRPDYIDHAVMKRLYKYGVDLIELGVQSFNNDVLKASKRGHDDSAVYKAISLIREYNIALGIQLMYGLPEDNRERFFFSVREAVNLKPEVMRIYPTLVLKKTELETTFFTDSYHAKTLEEAVETVKEAVKYIETHEIKLIRIGLQETDLITKDGSVIAGPYHPAFRDLIFDAIMLDCLIKHAKYYPEDKSYTVYVNAKRISHIRGQNHSNQAKMYRQYGIKIDKIIKTETVDSSHIIIKSSEHCVTYSIFQSSEVSNCI